VAEGRDASEGGEGRMSPTWLSFGVAGGAKVPFLKCNGLLPKCQYDKTDIN